MDRDEAGSQEARLLRMLEGLLALEVSDLETAMEQAAQRLAEVLGADKVDVFLHDPATQAMVAVGTSDTPMGRKQRALGLDRLPIAEGGRTVEVFQTGRSYLSRRADLEQGEPPRMIEELGVRSSINVPLEVAGERRGVLLASSATPEFFSERDLRFLEAVARWVGLASQRAVQVERVASRAAAEGVRRAAEQAVGILTPRQQEVAALIARGLTNAQIAERLVLTPGTAANHVEHILRTLGFRSRTQVAVWAAERGLLPPGGPDQSPE